MYMPVNMTIEAFTTVEHGRFHAKTKDGKIRLMGRSEQEVMNVLESELKSLYGPETQVIWM